jgi:hypothetical protein
MFASLQRQEPIPALSLKMRVLLDICTAGHRQIQVSAPAMERYRSGTLRETMAVCDTILYNKNMGDCMP